MATQRTETSNREADAVRVPKAPEKRTGFPCSNFGIGGEFSPEGRVFGNVLFNPPVLNEWLHQVGHGELSIGWGNTLLRTSEFENREIRRCWPRASMDLHDYRLDCLPIEVLAFAPVADHDAFTTSLPLLLLEVRARNLRPDPVQITVDFTLALSGDRSHEPLVNLTSEGAGFPVSAGHLAHLALACDVEDSAITLKDNALSLRVPLSIQPAEEHVIRIGLACYDRNGCYASRFVDIVELINYAYAQWDALSGQTDEFIRLMPDTDEDAIDHYCRWNMQAAVMLTRILCDGTTLTLGYCQLNQRDSFWTSPPHLVYWPDLERKMIEESAAHISAAGKIPTTILPVIEREDDLDINCYFVLRVFRYYEWTRDKSFLRELWPSVKKAIDWLAGRDREGNGLPEQVSYWGDWKDVQGVEGRKYGPLFCLLWLAALKQAAKWARQAGDPVFGKTCEHRFEKANDTMNRLVADGGLWTGSYYTNVWRDGRHDPHVLEDQVVGVLFDVVPPGRSEDVLAILSENWCEWGVRETYPYRPDEFGLEGGVYHNGGIWPWLCAVDAWARFRHGDREGGGHILRTVGHADLERSGDYLPHEYLRGTDGETVTDYYIQGWNAAYFGAVFFGMLGVEREGEDHVRISPRIPAHVSFSTWLRFPEGRLHVQQSVRGRRIRVALTPDFDKAMDVAYVPWPGEGDVVAGMQRTGHIMNQQALLWFERAG